MGNPPFVGYSLQSKEQKADMLNIYVDEKGKPYKTAGKIDYVAGWYFKASEYMQATAIRTAFVSTNSITQGEQVAAVWKPLYDRFGIHIDFAWRTFIWNSESTEMAHVHCVIVGFSAAPNNTLKTIYANGNNESAETINPYLMSGDVVFILNRTKPLCNVPPMHGGNRPLDGGNLIFTKEEMLDFVKKEPKAEGLFKKFSMGMDYIKGDFRYCLWLAGVSPAVWTRLPMVKAQVEKVREMRLNSSFEPTRRMADTPSLFREQLNPEHYLVIPKVSSEKRRYVPIGYLDSNVIPGDKLHMLQDCSLYQFGVLTSNVHMAWMRVVAGRLKSDYSYSIGIVYNNFPWCNPTDKQKEKIEKTAQGILDARAKYPDCNLATLYDEVGMPPELRKAHQANDRAVMEAYGFWGRLNTESECVAELMKMYQNLTTK